ncbi:iron ABC transporter permease [Parafrankia sp. FMc6]|uniref:FecCD family ABC transporter permease n=1 Tax=Parafrankia soli TaxID=2599596 RepID=UPI0034D471B5
MRVPLVLAGLVGSLAGVFLLALAVGSVSIPLDETLRVLVGQQPHDPRWTVVIREIRLPRAITAALAGAALGVAGLQMQTLFRNPLADPYSLGVSSGASLGVALVVAGVGGSGGSFTASVAGSGRFGVVVASAAGAAAVLGAVLLLSHWVRSVVTLLVIGVILNSAVGSLVSLLLTWTAPQRAIQYWMWSLGSFGGTSNGDLTVFAPVIGVGLGVALLTVKPLNALLLGENYARTLGLRLRRVRAATLLGASLLAGAVTAFCGPVAFLGIAVPHLARRLLGTADHRLLVPGTLLTGALLALLCSIGSQLPGTDQVVPINVITSLVGAPIVIAVLLRARAATAGIA